MESTESGLLLDVEGHLAKLGQHLEPDRRRRLPAALLDEVAAAQAVEVRSGDIVMLAPEARRRHLYIIGQTGTGKSTLLLNLIARDLAAGQTQIVGLAPADAEGVFRDRHDAPAAPHGATPPLARTARKRRRVQGGRVPDRSDPLLSAQRRV